MLDMFLICWILRFVSTTFLTQPQALPVFLQSESGSINRRDKTKSCKLQHHKRVFVSEIDKYTVSFFFYDQRLKLSLLN